MLRKENNFNNTEKNMKNKIKKYLRGAAAAALFGGLALVTPHTLQAKPAADHSVHVTVNVHGSDINVSTKVIEESVDKLLEAAEIHVAHQGGSSVTELKKDAPRMSD